MESYGLKDYSSFAIKGELMEETDDAVPRKSPIWLKTTWDCPEKTLEAVVDLLGVLSGSAVEQRPLKSGRSAVNAFFRLERKDDQQEVLERLNRELNDLFTLYELEAPEPDCTFLKDEEWATSWQKFFSSFAIIPGLVIKPSWEEYAPVPGEQIIEMDPGMAFGTGQHASTKLALALIRACFDRRVPEKVLDVGTGTGILSMGAALFGAKRIRAIDNDPEAVRVAGENIRHNALKDIITVSADSLDALTGRFDLICANIIHDVLVDMAPALSRLLADKGSVVLAGILEGEQEKNIIRVYKELGLILEEACYEDEWAALLLTA